MAGTGRTTIEDNVVVPVLVEAASAAYPYNPSIFYRSRAMIVDRAFPPALKGAKRVEVPSFGKIPKARITAADGTPVEVHRLESTGEEAEVLEASIAFSLTDRSGASPLGTYEEAGMQLMISIAEAVDDKMLDLVRAATWLKEFDAFSATIGSAPRYAYESYVIYAGSMVAWMEANPTSETERVALVAANNLIFRQFGVYHPYKRRPGKKTEGIVKVRSNATNFNHTTINRARQLLGEAGWNESPVMLAVHSDVMTSMVESRDASGQLDLVAAGPMGPDGVTPLYMVMKPWGIPILVTDKLNKTEVP